MRTMTTRSAAVWIVGIALAFSGACRPGVEGRVSRILGWERVPTAANVEKIREATADDAAQVRAGALAALVRLAAPDAKERARAALGDPDGTVRATAVKCLSDLRDADAVPLLVKVAVDDGDWSARRGAVEAVGRLGTEANAGEIASALTDGTPQVRLAAIEAVPRLGPASAVGTLSTLATTEASWEVRAAAAEALGRATSSEAYAPVKAALLDPNEFVRASAAGALRELRKAAVPEPEEAATVAAAEPMGPVLPGVPPLHQTAAAKPAAPPPR